MLRYSFGVDWMGIVVFFIIVKGWLMKYLGLGGLSWCEFIIYFKGYVGFVC